MQFGKNTTTHLNTFKIYSRGDFKSPREYKNYVRSYATNTNGTTYGNEVNFTIIGTSVSDYEGNEYGVVQIGNQIWMTENLKTTHYADGIAIPLVTYNTAWANLGDNNTDDAYCYYNNSQYGALYIWAAAMNGAVSSTANPGGIQGACPDGWHLPSDAEWAELVNSISNDGHSGTEGTALKSTSGWNSDGNGTYIYMVLQLFRVAAGVTAMVRSTMPATTATGGVVRNSVVRARTTAT